MVTSFLGRMRVRSVLRMQGGAFAPGVDIQKPRLKVEGALPFDTPLA